jgi:hypothetical protein
MYGTAPLASQIFAEHHPGTHGIVVLWPHAAGCCSCSVLFLDSSLENISRRRDFQVPSAWERYEEIDLTINGEFALDCPFLGILANHGTGKNFPFPKLLHLQMLVPPNVQLS